ncbi:MAG: AAA family ATPase [Acidobacteria bacterium]|nr:AAA family ATPase [Acidobacteriota bacterium]
MYIERTIQLPGNKNFFLFGPRQTGKSTLLKHKFSQEDTIYYDLLKSEVYRKLLARPEIFRNEVLAASKSKQPLHIIVDEVQKIPQLLDEVHFLVESEIPCYFILSGSSSRKLKRYQANMLAGRAWTFQLYSFSYAEIKDNFNLFAVLKYGTLPGVFLNTEEYEKKETLHSYVDTYIKEEIEIEANIRNLSGFLRFLPIAAQQNGELLNYSNIARETEIPAHIVKGYYKILEDTLLGFFLLPYAKSIRKKMSQQPKFYFFDPGIVTALTNRLRVNLEENTYEFGRAFEHFMILEILKLNHYYRLDLVLSFYRTERGAEVDCIIESPTGKILAIEIKSTLNPTSMMLKGLYSFKEKVPGAQLILCSRVDRVQIIKDVTVLPWQDLPGFILREA